MKATLTATLKHEKTGAVETAVVEVTTGNGDSRLFHLVGHMASALHAFQYQYQGRCNEPTHLQSKRYSDIINTQTKRPTAMPS